MMTKAKEDSPILDRDHYSGEITVNGVTAEIEFELSAGPDCRLVIEVEPVDSKTYLLVMRDSGLPGQTVGQFSLFGKTKGGKTVKSESVFLLSTFSKNSKYFLKMRAQSATVTLPLSKSVENAVLRLWFRSFRSFRNPIIDTTWGKLNVWGDAQNTDNNDMSGYVALIALSDVPDHSWYKNADDFLRHMHRGLTLAHGGRLQTPRLDYYFGQTHCVTFFDGDASKQEFPVQYHLDHGPFIRALVSRYENKGSLSDALWTALGWMQTDTKFDEVRFLTAMTALEMITQSQLPSRKGTTIAKSAFKTLGKKLTKVVDDEVDLSDLARDIFCSKIHNLNQKTLSEKISALFTHYSISNRDFENEIIVHLVKLRNEIVHKGVIPPAIDIWPQIILVRELVTRIFLSEIGFEGRYCCYIGGLHDRDFPEDANFSVTRRRGKLRKPLLDAARKAGPLKATPGPDAARSQDFLYGDDGLPQ
jgi:hypothetical protein